MHPVSIKVLQDFIKRDARPTADPRFTAVSLFSGGGLSDMGYELAGFRFLVQVELDQRRAAIGAHNFPNSTWLTLDVCNAPEAVQEAFQKSASMPLDLPDGHATVPRHEQFKSQQR